MTNRYTIEIIADAPPRLCLGDVIAGRQIVGINIGTNGKHLYNREQAIALLTTSAPKRGRRRAS